MTKLIHKCYLKHISYPLYTTEQKKLYDNYISEFLYNNQLNGLEDSSYI